MFTRRLIGIAFAATLATGCSSGGSSFAPPALQPPAGPIPNANSLTTYSTYVATVGAEKVTDVVPFGATSSLPGATIDAGGSVLYPDGSVQTVDAKGNFDASQSAWAAQNIDALTINPAMQPTVIVSSSSAANALPEEVSVSAYAPGGPLVVAGAIANAAGVPELASMLMAPKSVWLADSRTRIFSVAGKDNNNALFPLNKSQVIWTLARGNGCGSAAGRLVTLPSDASKAVYIAPASGSTAANCPDLVVAKVASGSATLTASAAAYSFDPKTSPQLAGVLKDTTGKPVANAIIDLYGAGTDSDQGSLIANTDSKGNFSRIVPASRIITPVVANVTGGKATYFAITPASINPATAGSALSKQSWTLAAQAQPPGKAAPNFSQILRDAAFDGASAAAPLPLDIPGTNGAYPQGSLEAILAKPVAKATGTITAGHFRGYAYVWDAAAAVLTATNGSSSYVITLNPKSVAGAACPSGATCYGFVQNNGTTLVHDGAWSQLVANGKLSFTYVSNVYGGAHTAAGNPLYTDTTSATVPLGTSSIAITIARKNGAVSLAAISTTRTVGNAPQLFAYTGSAANFVNGSGGKQLEADATLANGSVNDDGSGGFVYTVNKTPAAIDNGVKVTWNAAKASAAGPRASGTIDMPTQKNLQSGHTASFTVDSANRVVIQLDPALGGGQLSFTL